VDLATGRQAVEAVADRYGSPEVQDREEFVADQAAEVDQVLALVYGLLGLAIVIAMLGIAGTLSLSIHERTRELGLLRAVGLDRRQLRAVVRGEAVIVSLFGTAVGVALGVVAGWGLVRAAEAAEGLGTFSVPVGQLAVVLALGALVGALAAVRPARRAARTPLLAALSAP
jgi:putative ABC transport system permease protein